MIKSFSKPCQHSETTVSFLKQKDLLYFEHNQTIEKCPTQKIKK